MMDWQMVTILAVFFAVLGFAMWDLIVYPFLGDDDE